MTLLVIAAGQLLLVCGLAIASRLIGDVCPDPTSFAGWRQVTKRRRPARAGQAAVVAFASMRAVCAAATSAS